MSEFLEFPKMARWSREVIVTEKIDGTNAQICIGEDGSIKVGSRTRWITPDNDNFGFAGWVESNKDALLSLGPGRHFGEWWGSGIQRGYGQSCKKLSLFNTSRWNEDNLPPCVGVVPVLYQGPMDGLVVEEILDRLRTGGSVAAPGFMRPEGIVIYHVAGGVGFKKTLEKDEVPKTMACPSNRT